MAGENGVPEIAVAPLAGARIEMSLPALMRRWSIVAPLAGARIEIILIVMFGYLVFVAPLAGARIEILKGHWLSGKPGVAPLAGARIEIKVFTAVWDITRSLPSRERGLKSLQFEYCPPQRRSLPSRERGLKCKIRKRTWLWKCRSPRGSAD